MKEVIRTEILADLKAVIEFFTTKQGNPEKLQKISNHAIDDVALHKDLDVISITVLIYSIYKMLPQLRKEEKVGELVKALQIAQQGLEQKVFRKYNKSIKVAFKIIHDLAGEVKVHLQDVMQAARIKKGSILLQKGLSIGQAAGLMGLSNWDLQSYASKRVQLGEHTESYPAIRRMKKAFSLFNVQ
ncbi:TPA: hypothetical protein HA278_05255 [Candidatus Woesearchaeota archaeon]|nr:hypothetical protein [archaeon]HIJ11438.1 hypothetical protein [Candidatus Woesearchaeota archaeon]